MKVNSFFSDLQPRLRPPMLGVRRGRHAARHESRLAGGADQADRAARDRRATAAAQHTEGVVVLNEARAPTRNVVFWRDILTLNFLAFQHRERFLHPRLPWPRAELLQRGLDGRIFSVWRRGKKLTTFSRFFCPEMGGLVW